MTGSDVLGSGQGHRNRWRPTDLPEVTLAIQPGLGKNNASSVSYKYYVRDKGGKGYDYRM